MLNSAPAGRNPDAPAQTCLPARDEVRTDAVVQFGRDGAEPVRVWATFSTCTRRGLDNGVRQAHVRPSTIGLLMEPLRAGYPYAPDLDLKGN